MRPVGSAAGVSISYARGRLLRNSANDNWIRYNRWAGQQKSDGLKPQNLPAPVDFSGPLRGGRGTEAVLSQDRSSLCR